MKAFAPYDFGCKTDALYPTVFDDYQRRLLSYEINATFTAASLGWLLAVFAIQ